VYCITRTNSISKGQYKVHFSIVFMHINYIGKNAIKMKLIMPDPQHQKFDS